MLSSSVTGALCSFEWPPCHHTHIHYILLLTTYSTMNISPCMSTEAVPPAADSAYCQQVIIRIRNRGSHLPRYASGVELSRVGKLHTAFYRRWQHEPRVHDKRDIPNKLFFKSRRFSLSLSLFIKNVRVLKTALNILQNKRYFIVQIAFFNCGHFFSHDVYG